ncbi:MAG: hypothetical protein ACOH19_09425 [Rhodoglobus sp.]
MASSANRLFWAAMVSTVIAMLIEHVVWFLARSQNIGQALGFLHVPLLMGLVGGVLAGALAVAAGRLTRGHSPVLRSGVIVVAAALGAIIGTLFFPSLFLYKWFTIPILVVVVPIGMLAFARADHSGRRDDVDPSSH